MGAMKEGAESIIGELKQAGFRITPARHATLEILAAAQTPLDVAGLLQALSERGHRVNKTTVYRELSFLRERGIIQEIQFGEDKKRFELALGHHHHHLRCVHCHTIEDVDMQDDLAKTERFIAQQKQFKVINHALEFFGVCARCQA